MGFSWAMLVSGCFREGISFAHLPYPRHPGPPQKRRCHDCTPKTYHPNTEPQEVSGCLGIHRKGCAKQKGNLPFSNPPENPSNKNHHDDFVGTILRSERVVGVCRDAPGRKRNVPIRWDHIDPIKTHQM